MLTDEIKEKVGHARQVPGRHLDGDRERQTVPNHTYREREGEREK